MIIKSIIKSDKGIKVEEIIHLLTLSYPPFAEKQKNFFFLLIYSSKFQKFSIINHLKSLFRLLNHRHSTFNLSVLLISFIFFFFLLFKFALLPIHNFGNAPVPSPFIFSQVLFSLKRILLYE